ncbi:MAG: succinate dehydrogenase/fumarate reductase cytochrome b subunit [Porphyromonadaceae bacterium]|nr:succinate dehydrogenase/fumarate reductase cytochrome b subunit [Porphyromonadaceae bacterium]
MWLLNSSIGKKVVMSLTGLFLILFLTFHMAMNLVAVFSAEGFNMICEFLGANWYALVGSAVLAVGAALHILFALWLTYINRRARGKDRYKVTERPKDVEWSSQNMLVLGIIIVLGLIMHLHHFWFKMQFNEITGILPDINPHDGYSLIKETLGNPIIAIIYLIWIVAIWFHLTHGMWSSMQTLGANNKIWMSRWKCISNIYATIVCLGFAVVVIYFGFIA